MGQLIDISVTLDEQLPVWPDSHGVHISLLMDMAAGEEANVSRLDIDVHSGTHIDAPRHFLRDGAYTHEIPLEKTVGHCQVLDMRGKDRITADDLQHAALQPGIEKILFKTDNSEKWRDPHHTFDPNFCALTADAAQWVVDRGIHLTGIDYHSIQLFYDSMETHRILLRAKVVILEGLNLLNVDPGTYKLLCLPLKVHGVEGISARAVLETL
ncbi:MAG: cyclase family protein [Phaeodactylibacter sp.]|nr:cyclase family protein [Phaeodactylibacter sp.]